MEPTIFIQSLCRLLRVFQVPLEHIFTLDTDLEKHPNKNQSLKCTAITNVLDLSGLNYQ